MSKREIGYWWVKRPEGEEVVYWTGSEVQIFGSDATLREAEVEWLDPIIPPSSARAVGSASTDLFASIKQRREFFERKKAPPCPPAVATDGDGVVIDPSQLPIGVTSVRLGPGMNAHVRLPGESDETMTSTSEPIEPFRGEAVPAGAVLPPGYGMYEDWEEHGTYQTRLMPWAGRWTDSASEAAQEAWAHHKARIKASLEEAEAKAENRWKWMVDDAKRARDRLEREHGTWARLSSDEQMRVAENIRDTAFAAWRGQLLADGRWFGLGSAAQTLAESMDKRRAQITKMPIEQDVATAVESLREVVKDAVQQGGCPLGRPNAIDDAIAKVIAAARLSKSESTENPVTVTLIPYDPKHGEAATIRDEQWRPGKGHRIKAGIE